MGVPNGEDPLTRQDDERVGAADLRQRLGDGSGQRRGLGAGHQVQEHLGVRGRREEGALAFERGPDLPRVHEVAVVPEGQRAPPRGEDERLSVGEQRGPRRRVADVADRRPARQAREPRLAEDVGDVAHLPLDVDLPLVERRDPGRFLAAVLEGVEAEVRQVGGIVRVADAEDAAFVREAAPVRHWKAILTSEGSDLIPPGRNAPQGQIENASTSWIGRNGDPPALV